MSKRKTIAVPAAPDVEVKVTQEIIDESRERDSSSCMIAQALRMAGASSTNVTAESATFNMDGFRYRYPLPARAAANLIKFDEDKSSVKPFEFRLSGIQGFVKPVAKKPTDATRKVPKRKRKNPKRKAVMTNRRYHGLRMLKIEE